MTSARIARHSTSAAFGAGASRPPRPLANASTRAAASDTAAGGQALVYAQDALRRLELARDPVLRQFVHDRLTPRWSPEQMCQNLREEFPNEPERQVVPETVYQAIYRPRSPGHAKRTHCPADA